MLADTINRITRMLEIPLLIRANFCRADMEWFTMCYKNCANVKSFKSRYDNPIFSSFRNAKLKKEENVEKKAKNKIDQRKKCPLF